MWVSTPLHSAGICKNSISAEFVLILKLQWETHGCHPKVPCSKITFEHYKIHVCASLNIHVHPSGYLKPKPQYTNVVSLSSSNIVELPIF